MMSKPYNGYKNWTHWNVNLWLTSDEGLYRTMCHHIRKYKTKDEAAKEVFECLCASGLEKTPDGAKYSVSNIRAAMVGL